MKILILGSHGFIGSVIYSALSSDNDVYGCDIQKSDEKRYFCISAENPDFSIVFKQEEFDVCINASGIANVSLSMKNPIADFDANARNVFCILDCIRQYQSHCSFITLSSAAVYGNPERLPIKEVDKLKPVSPYGFDKMISENICRLFSEIYGVKTSCLRLFSVYGEGQKKMLLWDVCCKFRDDSIVSLFGTGNESRDYIHVTEIPRIISLIIERQKENFSVYNIANGKQIKVRYVAELIKQYMKSDKEIVFSNDVRKGDPLNWEADISKIKAFGYEPDISIEDGINKYVDWFKKQSL